MGHDPTIDLVKYMIETHMQPMLSHIASHYKTGDDRTPELTMVLRDNSSDVETAVVVSTADLNRAVEALSYTINSLSKNKIEGAIAMDKHGRIAALIINEVDSDSKPN